ncbi:MAG: dTDP-4-dehydrorhamnose reductase [Desulfobacteraceae bacterium]|jgi:dTDP-4-dehydrorhamnose reductase
MKILLLGSSGLLGNDCREVLKDEHEVIAPTSSELDIISWDIVIDSLHKISPDVIINCAGYTDVNGCETEDFKVRKINIEGPRNFAQGSARFNSRMIHISSDYVFSGQKGIPQPYFEDDPVDPISAYGRCKVESEVAVKENAPNYIIIRTSWLYGRYGNNFIDSLLLKSAKSPRKTIKVIDGQVGSPTWTYRLAHQIKALLKTDLKGTFHATSEGYCNRYEYAKHVFKQLNIKTPIKPCSISEYPQPAKRPLNCILENRLLKNLGYNVMADWKDDVNEYLEMYGKDLVKEAKAKK